MQFYRNESSYPKVNAQRNLCGRTHYVDDDALRFHKSRVLSARCTDNGLLFAIVTSDSLDWEGTARGFRYVIFDVFGNTVERPKLEDAYRTSAKATAAMWKALDRINAMETTRLAIAVQEKQYAAEISAARAELEKMAAKVDPVKVACDAIDHALSAQ